MTAPAPIRSFRQISPAVYIALAAGVAGALTTAIAMLLASGEGVARVMAIRRWFLLDSGCGVASAILLALGLAELARRYTGPPRVLTRIAAYLGLASLTWIAVRPLVAVLRPGSEMHRLIYEASGCGPCHATGSRTYVVPSEWSSGCSRGHHFQQHRDPRSRGARLSLLDDIARIQKTGLDRLRYLPGGRGLMTLQVNQIQRVADGGAYQVLLDVDEDPYLFVVRVQREPGFSISAPHSFWMACAEHDIDAQAILELVQRADAGDPMTWPVALSTKTGHGTGPQKLWGAKLGCRLPADSLRRAIGYYERRSDTTLFPKAFEYLVIRERWDDLSDAASSVDLLSHEMVDFRQLMAPKPSGGTRIATQLDPLDNILLTACVYELGSAFEAARVPADAGVVHSYRYQGGDEHLWDRRYSYASFLARAKELAEVSTTRFVAETDISSFYHRVPIEVAAHSLERAGAARKLLEGVCRMFPSFSNVGLPVGPMSSGLFAEAVLNEVDMALLSAGAVFVRYSDDYRFFCRSEVQARSQLQLLSELLYRKAGLTLHDTKTQIWDIVAYQEHLETKDAWLGDLREHMLIRDPKYGDPEPEALDDHERSLLAKAHDLLKQALDEQHTAWLRVCGIALEAIPLRERLDMLPGLLAQFGRLKPIARELSRSMTLFGRRRPSQREGLVDDVVSGIVNDQGRNAPDFGRMWLTYPFERGDWPALEELIAIPKRWPADRATRRQIVLALQHEPRLAEEIEIDPSDHWQRRAALRALGAAALRRRDSETDRGRWNTLLDAAIADTATSSEPYDEH